MTRKLRPRIFCIDDERAFCELMKRFLEWAGEFVVETECDAAKAMQAMKTFKPDIILLDVHMPKKNGFQLAGLIRAEPWLRHRPIVFYSGMADAEEAAYRAGNGGPTAFVRKGMPISIIEETVRRLLAECLAPDEKRTGRRESEPASQNAISMCPETRLGQLVG